jgi:hypothetical protein
MTQPPRRAGIPVAVGKNRHHVGPPLVDPIAQREAWTLDLLAFALHGAVASRVDLRGDRSPLPPVMLDLPKAVIALDLWQSVAALHSRPRSFSQIAGRYSPLVLAARESGKPLLIQWWDLRGEMPEDADKGAQALAKYLDATVTLHSLDDAHTALQHLPALPDKLADRNPMAWALTTLGRG